MLEKTWWQELQMVSCIVITIRKLRRQEVGLTYKTQGLPLMTHFLYQGFLSL